MRSLGLPHQILWVKGALGSVLLSWSLKTIKGFEIWQAAKPCVCTTCSCGKHKCAETTLTTKYQSLNIKETDKKFQGPSEYVAEYVPKQSNVDRITKGWDFPSWLCSNWGTIQQTNTY